MKYGPLIFFGIFLTLAASWCGLVLMPQIQIGRQGAVRIEETGEFYPAARSGVAQQGFEIYRANGCIYCHSQQVRMEGFGADILRNWGQRRTVARDYLNDKPVMLGTMRTGPDLANIGVRQTSAEWHATHLYNPRIPPKVRSCRRSRSCRETENRFASIGRRAQALRRICARAGLRNRSQA